jgi:mycothiol S-conjugate amidase
MVMANKRLLIVYAHPDDESFGNGGLIAKYVKEGVDVYYVCATDGDRGTIPDDMKDLYPTVRELRLSELDAATKILGFKHVYKLGYKDSGMMTDPTINDPDCLWYHSQQPDLYAKIVRRVVDIIRDIQPQVILTFNKYGGYGHPDHIAIQRATTEAFTLAGDADYLTDLPAHQPQKLYYGGLPTFMLKVMGVIMRLRGYDLRHMGTNKDIDFQAVIDNIEPTHTSVDIREYLEIWDEASKCHKSQGGGGMTRGLPNWLRKWLMGKQGFTRIHPQPTRNRVDEHDMFEGVTSQPIQQPHTL